AMERAVVLAEQDEILPSDFEGLFDSSADQGDDIVSLKDAIDGFKKEYITKALQANDWSQTTTAKVLEIERTYLNRLIKTLHITRY
ncbi:MAG: Fis family transcriptional regulator, partial [Spirochaetales bacterium]|nr:Fis family transcriptional regulator [Spirochaetales bacterium]